MKPLDVKTKFYNAESDEVFLEAQVNSSISKKFSNFSYTGAEHHTDNDHFG